MTSMETWLMVACIVFGILAMSFFCCVCCGFESLKLAIDVIDASADFLARTKRVIFVPMLFFVLSLIAIILWCGSVLCVVAMNEISADESIPQGKTIHWTDENKYTLLYMIFGILWICAFFDYCSKFIVMVSASTYYFDSHS
jgi:hypothetical protein